MPVFHVVYGLRVVSDLPLPGLIVSNERDSVDLRIRLKAREMFGSKFSPNLSDVFYTSPNFGEDGDSILRVGRLDSGRYIGFFYSDGVRFAVENQGREIWGDWPENYSFEDVCTYLVGPVIAFALRLRGITCLHASVVAVDGLAIALVGVAGAGKSTAAAAFALGGFPVLSDDLAVLEDSGDRFLVHSGYPRVNLWPDSVCAIYGFENALPCITPTWGKRYLPLDQNGHRFHAAPLPLGAIYILGQHEPGLITRIGREFTASDAFMALVSNTYVNYLLNASMRSREFDFLSRLVTRVPVRNVRRANMGTLSGLCEAVVKDSRQIANGGFNRHG